MPHGGQTEPAEDKDRVEQDVEQGAGGLQHHGEHAPAGGLEQPLAEDLGETACGEDAADGKIGAAALDGLCHIRLHFKVRSCAENAEQAEGGRKHKHEEQAVSRGQIGVLCIPLAEGAAEQGVDADGGADAAADDQILHRECQTQRRDGGFADVGNVDAVDDVIERLHQHGEDERKRHVHQQPCDRHGAHFVFLMNLF